MSHHPKLGLHVHSVALCIEAVGTYFIFMDTVRMDRQLHAAGFASYEGNAPFGYSGWVYHQASLGFGLLFLGMLAAAFVLWLEHRALNIAKEKLSKEGSLPEG